MKYTLDKLFTEYVNAVDSAMLASKANDDAQARYKDALNSDQYPDISRFDNSEEAKTERAKWRAEYAEPAANAAKFKHETALYRDALKEMIIKTANAIIQDRMKSEEFRAKFDGTPTHYKRFSAAVFGDIDERINGYMTEYGYYRLSIRPVKGAERYAFHSEETHLTGVGHGEYSAELAEKHVRYSYADNLPTFAKLRKACINAADIREKRRAILDAADKKANELTKKSACGLNCLYDEITK